MKRLMGHTTLIIMEHEVELCTLLNLCALTQLENTLNVWEDSNLVSTNRNWCNAPSNEHSHKRKLAVISNVVVLILF